MRYRSISEIYEANGAVRVKLKNTLQAITDEQAAATPAGETWSIAQIAEHVSLVEQGMYKICSRLLSKAEAGGRPSNGNLDLDAFADKALAIADVKLEAPEIVRPTGTRSIAESVRVLDETEEGFRSLRPLFEKYDTSEAKFPHPYFGDMTAVEWLAMCGAHEGRHLQQIRRIIQSLDAAAGK